MNLTQSISSLIMFTDIGYTQTWTVLRWMHCVVGGKDQIGKRQDVNGGLLREQSDVECCYSSKESVIFLWLVERQAGSGPRAVYNCAPLTHAAMNGAY